MLTNDAINSPDAIIIGRLQREYILPGSGPARLNKLGGNLAYTAAGLALWGGRAGLVSRVNADFPLEWLAPLVDLGSSTEGIRVVAEPIQHDFFVAYSDAKVPHYENPLTYFAERKLPFPRELLGYEPASRYCSKVDYQAFSFRVTDLPRSFLEAPAAHICPIDFVSHKILPSSLGVGLVQTLTMRATSCYMDPIYWEDIRGLISDLTCFMLSDTQALKLFQGRSVDLWEIARVLGGYGPEYILINTADGAAWLYDRVQNKRWIIPAYGSRTVDPTGGLNAFDGGFLHNYRVRYDSLQAALCGQVSASLTLEGSGPFYALDCLQGLREARLEVLAQQVMAL